MTDLLLTGAQYHFLLDGLDGMLLVRFNEFNTYGRQLLSRRYIAEKDASDARLGKNVEIRPARYGLIISLSDNVVSLTSYSKSKSQPTFAD